MQFVGLKFSHILYNEFSNGITPHASLTTKDGLLLQTLTSQHMDSTNDDSICTCHIALGHKNKENMLTENTHIDEMSKREDPNQIKFYS